MSALPKRYFTPEEYLELEAKAEYKSQYFAGEIFAMAGAQPAHDTITGNILAGLHTRFRGRDCSVLTADMRVRAGDDMTPILTSRRCSAFRWTRCCVSPASTARCHWRKSTTRWRFARLER